MRYVIYTATRNYYADTIPSMKSLLKHTHVDRVFFLIEDDVFPFPLPDCVEVKNVSHQHWFRHDGPNFTRPWTYMVLMRAAYTKILTVDKVLNLDADVIVEDDISELWDLDMSDYYIAGATEINKHGFDQPYINFGVCMMNLAKLRDGTDDRIIYDLNNRYRFASEQDSFNLHCGKKLVFSSTYNANAFTAPCANPKVIHFAGIGEIFPWSRKRWQDHPIVQKYREADWEIK